MEDERQEEVQEVSSSTVVGGGIAVEDHNEDDNLVNCSSSIEMGEELLEVCQGKRIVVTSNCFDGRC